MRAKIVSKEEDFPHSSAKAHITGIKDEILGEELFAEGQRKDYAEFIRSNITEEEIKEIRYYTKTGRPLGSEKFVRSMERKLNRTFAVKSPGRSKKKE